jgi:hypothetical protein
MKKIMMMLTALLAVSLSACSQKKTETKMDQNFPIFDKGISK